MASPWEMNWEAPKATGMPWEQNYAPSSLGNDLYKSGVSGVESTVAGLMGFPGTVADLGAKGLDYATQFAGKHLGIDVQPRDPNAAPMAGFKLPNTQEMIASADRMAKESGRDFGASYQPQTTPGKYTKSVTEFVTNPMSYAGPGSLAFKAGTGALAGIGSEGGRQATEGTKYEGVGQVAGALLGAVAGGKAFGPTAPKAAIPASDELMTIGGKGFDAARNSGLELKPQAISDLALRVQQDLLNKGLTPVRAKETHALLDGLQSVPQGGKFTAINLDDLRLSIGDIAKQVQPTAKSGVFAATPDAAAAAKVADRLKQYMAAIPQNHVLAGDAAAYVRNTKQALGDYAAGKRSAGVETKLTKAENAVDRQVAGSIDSQIKQKLGQTLDNPTATRGWTQEELAQLKLAHGGNLTSNILRQLGRGGAGVHPVGGHIIAAMLTGGGSIPYSAALAPPLYAARKIAEALTKGRASKLDEMLRMNSPEYRARIKALAPSDSSPQRAAIVRALMESAQMQGSR